MLKNKYTIILVVGVSILILVFFVMVKKGSKGGFKTQEINPVIGDIRLTVSTTGVVEPQNRLQIKSSINGRIEEILVEEGDKVKKGDILARMSSTERAALVDAARSQGDEALQYWEEVYHQSSIVSPIDGEVIVRAVEPGQTVTTSDTVLVLSDRLIVSAQFDETDIGRVELGQNAVITLDAYPQVKIAGVVDHIAYESELVSNVNIYDVDVLPQDVPKFFRSGMSANVEVIEKERKNVILIPAEAIRRDEDRTFVTVKKKPSNGSAEREIKVGLSDERDIEVVSGLTTEDVIIVKSQVYALKKKSAGTNPFMPSRERKK